MADTQTRVNTTEQPSTDVAPHEGVEVFDTNGTPASHQAQSTAGNATIDDVGFGHADLQQAEVIRGEAAATDFRSTDLGNSELNNADFAPNRQTDLSDNAQGTNWGTILMVIALILVIILVGSWLF